MYALNFMYKLGYLIMTSLLYHGALMDWIGGTLVIVLGVCAVVCGGLGILSESALQIMEPRITSYFRTQRGFITLCVLTVFIILNTGIHYV